MLPCMIAWLYRGLTMSMFWHWRVCCALSTIYIMSWLRETLTDTVRSSWGLRPNSSSQALFWTLPYHNAVGFHASYPWAIRWFHGAVGQWLAHVADVCTGECNRLIFIVRNIHSLAINSVTSTIWRRRNIKQNIHFSNQILYLK